MPFQQEISAKHQVRDYNKIVKELNDESKKEMTQGGRNNRDKQNTAQKKESKNEKKVVKKREQKIRYIEFNITKPMQDSLSMISKTSSNRKE